MLQGADPPLIRVVNEFDSRLRYMDTIAEFQGEYRFLSNFYPSLMRLGTSNVPGILFDYPTVEHAFQACKVSFSDLTVEERLVGKWKFTQGTPGQAKRLGRKVALTPEKVTAWNDSAYSIMYALQRMKYSEHPDLADLLVATGDATLIEGNNWGDKRWGQVNGEGENLLGKILMQVRQELTSARESAKMEA